MKAAEPAVFQGGACIRLSSSLSDLTKSAANSGKTAHFSPYFCTS